MLHRLAPGTGPFQMLNGVSLGITMKLQPATFSGLNLRPRCSSDNKSVPPPRPPAAARTGGQSSSHGPAQAQLSLRHLPKAPSLGLASPCPSERSFALSAHTWRHTRSHSAAAAPRAAWKKQGVSVSFPLDENVCVLWWKCLHFAQYFI